VGFELRASGLLGRLAIPAVFEFMVQKLLKHSLFGSGKSLCVFGCVSMYEDDAQ
jgi:hypothetical protein